jgi:glycosyltransferase involved in cell wall biosynthesis
MKIYHIGIITIDSESADREIKSIGGIAGYINELIKFSLSCGLEIGFAGKIYNYSKESKITYINTQEKVTSTNKFLASLFINSLKTNLPKDAIIHAHRPDHLTAYMLFNNRPSIITIHGQQVLTINIRKGKLVRTIYKVMEKIAIRRANALIAVDPRTKELYEKLHPKHKHKIHVIPTGVNTDLFMPLGYGNTREELGIQKDEKVMIYVGRIEPPKKIQAIINVARLLIQEDPKYKLILVGDGVQMKEMREMVRSGNLQNNIQFLGIRKSTELPKLYSASDVSILLSGNEGSPLSVKESLACGVPVVANEVGDIKSVIKNNYNGFVVDDKNTDEVINAIKSAINNSQLIKQNCIDSIQPFTIQTVSRDILRLYEKICNE